MFPIQFGKSPRPESFQQETPPHAKKPKINAIKYLPASPDPALPYDFIKRHGLYIQLIKKPCILNGHWHYNKETYQVIRLAQGTNHRV